MSTGIEEVSAELLSKEAKKSALLSNGKFGCGKKMSAIDAGAIMVDSGNAAWDDDIITVVLLMYTKTAFARVARGRLIHAIKTKTIEGDHIHGNKSCL